MSFAIFYILNKFYLDKEIYTWKDNWTQIKERKMEETDCKEYKLLLGDDK